MNVIAKPSPKKTRAVKQPTPPFLTLPAGVDLLAFAFPKRPAKPKPIKPPKPPPITEAEIVAYLQTFAASRRPKTNQISAGDYMRWVMRANKKPTKVKRKGETAPVTAKTPPTLSQIAAKFGSWWEACRAANLYPKKIPQEHLTAKLLTETMLAATFDAESNPRRRPPSPTALAHYAQKTGCPVSAKTFNRIFAKGLRECWELVLAGGRKAKAETRPNRARTLWLSHHAARFQVTIPASYDLEEIEAAHGLGWTDGEMLTALTDCAIALKQPTLTQDEFDAWRGVYGAQQIAKRFHGWEAALRTAGLIPTTIFVRDVTARDLVQHMIDAAMDVDANPKRKPPTSRQILYAHGVKVKRMFTHHHYETLFGSMARCWEQIVRWQRGEITERELLEGSGS